MNHHRPPFPVDHTPVRASDAFYAEKRRERWTHYAVLMLFLIVLLLGAALLASLIGKAAANIHVTLEDITK